MCIYCVLKNDEYGREKTNDNGPIISIKDGSRVLELYLDRYVIEAANIHDSELRLNSSFALGEDIFTVEDKTISIKYCPFCGERL